MSPASALYTIDIGSVHNMLVCTRKTVQNTIDTFGMEKNIFIYLSGYLE